MDPRGGSPSFLVAAFKDPNGANLDRIQVVKGWLDSNGAEQEVVYDVAWSGDRQPGSDGLLPAVGDSVNRATGGYENTIGSVQLKTLWQDPDFEASQAAFYYVRVLQIPTPRHALLDALALKVAAPSEGPLVLQERESTIVLPRPGKVEILPNLTVSIHLA